MSCTRILYKIKKRQWKKFVESFDCKTPISDTWRLIKAFKRRNLSEPSSVISDDNRQNNLLEKVKEKGIIPSSWRISLIIFRRRIILVSTPSHFYHVRSKSLRRLSI
ncbi:PREDICTED: uncharacterized protein LOC108692713 [Atta colombica]|uniref:uncharacterized protein LOC108692713 n=1 Tax=Atta colombica TaxID=520822 RepID=UPI00084BDB39|nr:PREDICTED: uncharacterized protein LOC108692713 [Atta colombica]XP_018056593.1 PREDICTED: uncharacterized protein LOC108692713 [Atta colombica]